MKELGIEQDPVTEELEPPVEDPDVNTSGDIIDFIAGFEGFRETAYDDYGQLTIGFGTPATSADQTITREDAMKELSKEVMKARTVVLEAAKEFGYDWSDNQVDALTSFTFNLGQGNFNKLLKGDEGGLRGDEEISEMILEYNKAGGKVLPGLTKRRQAEADLFTQGYNS
jgi:lysozyme